MAGIALVAAEIDCAIDADRQVGVDLDPALGIALIIIVAAPALASDEGQLERLLRGELDVLHRPPPALGDGGIEHGLQTVLGDREAVAEGLDALGEWSAAR